MRELRDQRNNTIIRNYVVMPDRLQFSALEVSTATGVNIQTCRNVLGGLCKSGIIVKLAKRMQGRAYYRTADDKELLLQKCREKGVKQVARERGVTKEAVYQKVRPYMVPKDLRATDNQLAVLKLVAAGEDAAGFRQPTLTLLKKGWIVEKYYDGFCVLELTDKGREVLNAQG